MYVVANNLSKKKLHINKVRGILVGTVAHGQYFSDVPAAEIRG